MYIIEGKKDKFEVVIGCEIHAQIASNTKLFSRSSVKYGATQNSQVSFFDAAMPGMLPVINKICVSQAVKTGLGINARINHKSSFDRKNYFYPDLPQGYQISQFYEPIVSDGYVEIIDEDNNKKIIKIERVHIEQDAGKSIHDQSPHETFIDLNRAGIGLMEIVSKPDLRSPFEASEYVKKIRAILRALGTCDGDMEKGNLRCDANVSVRIIGENKLGTRCEIKNLNSTRNIIKAIEFEANRQVEILENGGAIDQETRLFDAVSGETRTMRSKEDALDYRYFPDPDLPNLIITNEFIEEIRRSIPELPDAKKERFIKEFSISEYDAGVLTSDSYLADYFEKLISKHNPQLAVTWLTVELMGRLNKEGVNLEESNINADRLISLLDLIKEGVISAKIAKDILDEMLVSDKDPSDIVKEKGLEQVSDSSEIEKVIIEVLNNNQNSVSEYRSGKDRLFGFFVGQVMKETKGKANPKLVNDILKKHLDK